MFSQKYSKYPVYIGALIALLFTTACNLQPFSSVKVKAKPKLYVPLGSKSMTSNDIDEHIRSILAPKDGSSSGTEARIFRYTPPDAIGEDKNQLRYLIHYPVKSLDFDISKYFGENAVASGTGLSYKVDETISVPTLETTETCTIAEPKVINTKLLEAFNNAGASAPPSIDIPAGTLSGYEIPVTIDITFEGFEEVTFDNRMSLTVSVDPPAGVSCSFSDAKLTSNGNTFNGYSPYASPNVVNFNIDDKPISNRLRLTGRMKVSGSTPSGGTVTFTRTLTGTIKEAKGVNAHLENLTPTGAQTIALPLPDAFKKAVIGEGSLQFSLPQPKGWSGIAIKEKTKIEQAEKDGVSGLLIDPPDFRPLGGAIDLAGLTLNDSKTLTYTPILDVTLTNATYRKPSESLSAKFGFSIQKFTELTLKNKTSFESPKPEPIPEALKKWIKTITFTDVSARVKLLNGLPEGNPITLKLSSTAFHIAEQSHAFPAQQQERHPYTSASNWTLDVDNTSQLDLQATVELPNYNASDKTFTLKNISTGTDIKVSVETSFDLNWEKMTLKKLSSELFSYPEDDFIDLSVLSDLQEAHLKMPEVPVYVYAGTASGLLANTPIKVGLSVRYKEDDQNSPQSMLLCNETDCRLRNFPTDTFVDTKKEYTEAIPPYSFAIKKGESVNTLADIMNKYPTGVQLTYTISMDGMEIKRSEYDAIVNKGGKAEIKLDVLLELPVGFTIDTDDPISLMPFMKTIGAGDFFKGDLLQRSNANDKLIDEQITDALQAIQLDTNIRNESGLQPTVIFRAKAENGTKLVEKELLSATGKRELLLLTKDEWDKIQNTYPVYPELLLKFPNKTIKINKDFTISGSFSVVAETNIDYTIL